MIVSWSRLWLLSIILLPKRCFRCFESSFVPSLSFCSFWCSRASFVQVWGDLIRRIYTHIFWGFGYNFYALLLILLYFNMNSGLMYILMDDGRFWRKELIFERFWKLKLVKKESYVRLSSRMPIPTGRVLNSFLILKKKREWRSMLWLLWAHYSFVGWFIVWGATFWWFLVRLDLLLFCGLHATLLNLVRLG